MKGIEKFGEGSWGLIRQNLLKTRSASQVSQRWNSFKKKVVKGVCKNEKIKEAILRLGLAQTGQPASTITIANAFTAATILAPFNSATQHSTSEASLITISSPNPKETTSQGLMMMMMMKQRGDLTIHDLDAHHYDQPEDQLGALSSTSNRSEVSNLSLAQTLAENPNEISHEFVSLQCPYFSDHGDPLFGGEGNPPLSFSRNWS